MGPRGRGTQTRLLPRRECHRARQAPFWRSGRPRHFLLLILALLHTPPPSQGSPVIHNQDPFTYNKNPDLRNQRVIFNPIGKYATDVTFVHAGIRVPFKHIRKHHREANRVIDKLHDVVNGSLLQTSTGNTLVIMRVPLLSQRSNSMRPWKSYPRSIVKKPKRT